MTAPHGRSRVGRLVSPDQTDAQLLEGEAQEDKTQGDTPRPAGAPQGSVSSHQRSMSPCNLEIGASVSHLYREGSKSRWLVLCWNMHPNYLESCFQVTEAPASVLLPTPREGP